ncbi:MAG: GntR family transcriptional regulator [Clostridia bacterium]|nr:GntR family transcriptional regulator [Clostridia bacterium]
MITIDYKDRRSIYEQLVDRIKALAAGGMLPPGSQLPSVRQLSSELSINPNTVQRAYSELERDGIIYSVKGRGKFVSQDASLLQRSHQERLLEDFKAAARRALQSGLTPDRLRQALGELGGEDTATPAAAQPLLSGEEDSK